MLWKMADIAHICAISAIIMLLIHPNTSTSRSFFLPLPYLNFLYFSFAMQHSVNKLKITLQEFKNNALKV